MAKEQNKTNILVPILVLLLVIAAFAIGMLWQQNKNLTALKTTQQAIQPTASAQQPTQPQITLDTIKGLFNKDVIALGDKNSKLVFVAVEDPSCPFCAVASGKNSAINKDMDKQSGRKTFTLVSDGGTYVAPVVEMKKLFDSGKAAFIYIYSPGHGNGEMGTKALYCANEMDKFWEAHDLLMSAKGYDLLNNTVQNDSTKSQVVADFLKSAVDPSKMKACLDSGKYDDRIAGNTSIADSLGVRGTPSFFVNTTNYPGAVSYEAMKSAVESALGS
jgi:protein-disulfide isomerase